MPKKGLLAGNKITKSHSTIIHEAAKLINFAKNVPEISKLAPSEIVPLSPAARHLKLTPIPAGLKVAVRGKNARQIIFVYTNQTEIVTQILKSFWEKSFPE